MKRNYFGIVEMIGSVVLVLLDPVRTNNKKYLDKKYNSLNRIVGFITLSILIIALLYLIVTFIF